MGSGPKYSRKFAMGNHETFLLSPVAQLLDRWLEGAEIVVDPFARNSKRGTITNDLNPAMDTHYHLLAEEFVAQIQVKADAVLFDPPYSPRQIAECYQQVGRKCSTQDTQNARLYRRVKDGLDRMLRPGGIADLLRLEFDGIWDRTRV